MINLKSAIAIAEEYLSNDASYNLVLLHDNTIEFELGWVFFYQTKEYAETGDYLQMADDNAPIIVNKNDGSIHITGTAYRIERYIREYVANNQGREKFDF